MVYKAACCNAVISGLHSIEYSELVDSTRQKLRLEPLPAAFDKHERRPDENSEVSERVGHKRTFKCCRHNLESRMNMENVQNLVIAFPLREKVEEQNLRIATFKLIKKACCSSLLPPNVRKQNECNPANKKQLYITQYFNKHLNSNYTLER